MNMYKTYQKFVFECCIGDQKKQLDYIREFAKIHVCTNWLNWFSLISIFPLDDSEMWLCNSLQVTDIEQFKEWDFEEGEIWLARCHRPMTGL